MNRVSKSQRIIKILLFLFFIVSVFCPLSAMFLEIANTDVGVIFQNKQFFTATINSLVSTTLATMISALLSGITAWFLTRSNLKFKSLFLILFTVPMLIPSISHGTGLVVLLGTNGVLTNLFNLDFNVYGLLGIILGAFLYSFPVGLLMFYDVFQYEDGSVYTSANVLGIPKYSQFFRVTLPYLKKPLISVFFAVFTMIFTDYGVPLMVGGQYMTLPLYMYNEAIGLLDFGRGAVIGCILIIPAFIAFILDLLNKDKQGTAFVNQQYVIIKNKVRDVLASLWSVIIAVLVLLPVCTFAYLMFVDNYPISMSFSMSHVQRAFDMGMMRYLGHSLIIAVFTALIGTIVSYIVAYFTARTEGKSSKALHLISMITLAIPGIVLGLSYVLFFNGNVIYGTLSILILVNTVHFFSSPYLLAYNALGKLNRNYENVAKTLGINGFHLVKDILIPQSVDTILEIASYFFVNSMVTISAVSFLSSMNNQPLALMIPNLESMMLIESISFVSIVILGVNLILKAVIHGLKKLIPYLKNRKMAMKGDTA